MSMLRCLHFVVKFPGVFQFFFFLDVWGILGRSHQRTFVVDMGDIPPCGSYSSIKHAHFICRYISLQTKKFHTRYAGTKFFLKKANKKKSGKMAYSAFFFYIAAYKLQHLSSVEIDAPSLNGGALTYLLASWNMCFSLFRAVADEKAFCIPTVAIRPLDSTE